MTSIDFKALRATALADGHDAETLEFLENLWLIATEKTCEGIIAAALTYDLEAFVILTRLMKKVVPRSSFAAAPDIVTIDDWAIRFAPGDLHVEGNLPLEDTMVIVLGNLTVDGVVGSYRDFEATRLTVIGDLTCAGLECDKDVFVDGTASADLIWFEGKEGRLVAKIIDCRVLYDGSGEGIEAETVRADHRFTKRNPVNLEAMQSVLAPEAFVPEPGYVFEGHPGYGVVNRALRLLQLGRPGLLHH